MLKDSKNGKKAGPYIITDKVQKVFKKLKNAFFSILVLQYFDFSKLIYIETDALGFAITGILSQLGNLISSWWSDAY